MGLRLAAIVLLCVLAGCERRAAAPLDGAAAGNALPAPVAAAQRAAGTSTGGFGDAWSMRDPVPAGRADAPAAAATPREQMRDQIARFRAARLRAQQARQATDPFARPQPGARPGDLVEQRAGDRVFAAADAGAAQFTERGAASGVVARAGSDPAMKSSIERFRAAQLSRNGTVPARPTAVPGIAAGTRPGDTPGQRPGDLAPPRW
ncbi:hypothetical protein [Massilia sp. GCM10023247]|uniref:hypothetical protein n=1 Tax=Massilia sp. GCM10023247 TaxID=3252643 RepID=UPI0036D3DEC3